MKCLYLAILLAASTVHAGLAPVRSNKPLYEFGVIGGTALIPDYPGSEQSRFRYLVFPQIRYRGLRFRSDEEDNLKARFLLHPLYGFDLSAAGALPAKSDQNDARKGMEDLDWIGEIGPRFYLFLVKTDKLWVRTFLPLRLAFSTDFKSTTYQGLVVAPALNVRYYFDDSKFNSLIFGVARTHTTHQIQEFYYEVQAKDATLTRPVYDAKSGYQSTSSSLGYLYEKDNVGVYLGMGFSSFKGAANAGSPLHTAEYNLAGVLGVSYLFFKSEERGYQ